MNLVKVKCAFCGKEFFRRKGQFKEAKKFSWKQYCSWRCLSRDKIKRRVLVCENCGERFERTPHEILAHNYCSQSCAAIINNKKRPDRDGLTIKCKNCGIKFKKWILNNKNYCSVKCLNEAERYAPEELLNIIKKTFKKLGRVPARREMFKGTDKACIKFFGSWNNAVLAAGFTPNRSHDNRMYKRANAKALDGHLCDSISELLIDNWFVKNKITHERNISYPDTNHKADWGINFKGKTIFVEYFGLAKDSPRYDRSVAKKKTLCYEHKIKLIEVYPWDLYPKINLGTKLKIFLN